MPAMVHREGTIVSTYLCSAPYSSSNSQDRQGRGHGQISPGLRTPGPIHPFGVDGIAPPQPATQAALNPRLRHHFWPPSWATLLHRRSHPISTGHRFFRVPRCIVFTTACPIVAWLGYAHIEHREIGFAHRATIRSNPLLSRWKALLAQAT